MSNPFQLTFTLKQHTPIIHFQHEQEGATLRATEVKPKLDRFIIQKLGGFEKLKHLHPDWLAGKKEHPALYYKMNILADVKRFPKDIGYTETPDGKWRPNYPCIFGNVEKESEKKYLVVSQYPRIVVTSNNETLLTEIEHNFCAFLENHNFGFRQSKGFGSFYLSETNGNYALPETRYHFAVDVSSKTNDFDKYKELFKNIDLLYKTLRSGINTSNLRDGIYFKSLMFMYAKSPPFNQQWDKRTIREYFYINHPTYNAVKTRRNGPNGTVHFSPPKKDNLLFRDLLGLSTEQDWMGYGKPKTEKNGTPKTDKNGNPVYKSNIITKESTNGEIERFQSPLMFKPIRREGTDIYDIYIIAHPIPQKYFGQSFKVKSKSQSKACRMSIPESFDVSDYLDFCFTRVFLTDMDFDEHISNINNSDAKTLRTIFSELKNCRPK